jgi:hypothetical protein
MANHHHRLPPDFEYDSDFPLKWCAVKGKLHCDKANVHKFPRHCPFCKFIRYENFASWQQHVGRDHHCIVTTVYTEEQKKQQRAISVRHYVETKRSKANNNRKKKKQQRPNRNNDNGEEDFDRTENQHDGLHTTDVPSSGAETLVLDEKNSQIQKNAGLLNVLVATVDSVTDQHEVDETERRPVIVVHYHGSRVVPRRPPIVSPLAEDGGGPAIDEECAAIFAHVDAMMIPFHDCAFYPGTLLVFKVKSKEERCAIVVDWFFVTDVTLLSQTAATFDISLHFSIHQQLLPNSTLCARFRP